MNSPVTSIELAGYFWTGMRDLLYFGTVHRDGPYERLGYAWNEAT